MASTTIAFSLNVSICLRIDVKYDSTWFALMDRTESSWLFACSKIPWDADRYITIPNNSNGISDTLIRVSNSLTRILVVIASTGAQERNRSAK